MNPLWAYFWPSRVPALVTGVLAGVIGFRTRSQPDRRSWPWLVSGSSTRGAVARSARGLPTDIRGKVEGMHQAGARLL